MVVIAGGHIYGMPNFKDYDHDSIKSKRYLASGLKNLRVRKYAEAITDFTKAIEEDRMSWIAYRLRGDAKKGIDEYKSSIDDYGNALRLNSSDALSYRGRAEAKRLSNDAKGALSDYDVVLSLNPKDTAIRFGRALCEFHLELFGKAISDLNIFLEKWIGNQDQIIATRLRGEAYFQTGEHEKAINDFNRYFKLGGRKEDVVVLKGISHYFLRNQIQSYLDSAITNLREALDFYPKNIVTLRYLGMSYASQGDFNSADVYLQQALTIDSNDVESLYSLIMVKAFKTDFKNEYSLFQKYLKIKPVLTNGFEYYYLGLAKWGAEQDTIGAVQAFERASESGDVGQSIIFRRFFELLLGNANYDAKINGYITDEIRQTKDSLKMGYLYASRSLVNEHQGNSIEAKSDIEKASVFSPKSPIIYLVKGAMGKKLHFTNSMVLQNYDKAIELDKKFHEAYLMKAYFYRQQGNLQKSCFNLSKANELGAKTTDSLNEYLCKGGNLVSGKESELNLVIYPYLRDSVVNSKYK